MQAVIWWEWAMIAGCDQDSNKEPLDYRSAAVPFESTCSLRTVYHSVCTDLVCSNSFTKAGFTLHTALPFTSRKKRRRVAQTRHGTGLRNWLALTTTSTKGIVMAFFTTLTMRDRTCTTSTSWQLRTRAARDSLNFLHVSANMDTRDDYQENYQTDANPVSETRCIDVLPLIPTELQPNNLFYSMKNPVRGLAIIFNHESYDEIDGKQIKTRDGTSEDVKRLSGTLFELGFQVHVQENLTHAEIQGLISDVSKNENLFCHDCLAVFVLTHGDEHDKVYAKDKTYFVKELVEPFTAKNCLYLANKPKLFFIQACKGRRLQETVFLRNMTDSAENTNANETCVMYSIPAESDILISYATLEGYIAARDPTWGSPYIKFLCDELERNGTTLDLLSILTRVHHGLANSTYKLIDTKELIKVQASFLCYLNKYVKFSTPDFLRGQTQ